jgi:hypothetical protein
MVDLEKLVATWHPFYSLLNEICAATATTLQALNPRGEIKPPRLVAPTARISDLAGKIIGI